METKHHKTWTGIFTLVLAAAVILYPIVLGSGLEREHLLATTILGTIGGLLTDPTNFKEIALNVFPWYNKDKK